ncbi:MAG: hypothetical protein DCC56_15095 [Anaerolineae bacterium]|nr:MAG: hypothetical protein DCC56_15095 [Anaerolineae bacterium]WKZ42462.1 MAG: N-acetylmuramoyl-L-alanine amidase [Anaerolineales bacterium]
MKIVNNELIMEAGEGTPMHVGPGTFVWSVQQMQQQQIVIHAVGYRRVDGALGDMQAKPKPGFKKRSVHIILDADGKKFAQMVPFNKIANHTIRENNTSLGIELLYRGASAEPKTPDGEKAVVTKAEFEASPHIYASSANDSRYERWPLFPKAQLDALFEICKAIDFDREIIDVVGCEQIQNASHPGPAFPIVQFREQLLGVTDRSVVLQKLGEAVQLLGRPAEPASILSPAVVPAGTPVTVVNEWKNWYLISIIGEVDGNRWLVGWVKKSAVRVDTSFTPKVRNDHILTTTAGRRFELIPPHENGYDTNPNHRFNPKYIIMHFTTGTRVESTISHFKNPAAGVATHLLIGRDGRVIQFLPFNVPANHTGYSWWEGERSLNRFSIGIEMDNVGPVSFINGKWRRKSVIFEEDEIEKAVHWKELGMRAWEKFPPVQVEVARKIVRALLERYKDSVVDILGHDQVNIINRLDPGPAFHLEDFRMSLMGRAEPKMQIFVLNQPAPMYANADGSTPNVENSEPDGFLPEGSMVIVSNKTHGNLVKVTVTSSPGGGLFKKRTGWIEAFAIEPPEALFGNKKRTAEGKRVRRRTKVRQAFYPRGKNPPSPKIKAGMFAAGTEVRKEEDKGEWSLVVMRKMEKGMRSVEGWVQTKFLTKKE